MKSKLRIACAALLTATALPAFALQLGEIQVKSTLNQPLVAAIPLQPKNLTELEGLTVGLAPADDFARAGLQVTPTDQTLQFHVVTDNNGQKLIRSEERRVGKECRPRGGQPVAETYA